MPNGKESATAISSVPSVTGNPMYDSLLRSLLLAGSAAVTAWIVTWMAAHNITDPNLNLLVGGAVLTTLSTLAMAVWGAIAGHQVKQVIVEKQVEAVNATLNLAAANKVETTTNDTTGVTTAVPATPETAKEIIKNYGTGTGDGTPIVQSSGTGNGKSI